MTSEFFKKQAEDLAKQAEEFNKQVEFATKQRDEYIGASKYAFQMYQSVEKQEKQEIAKGDEPTMTVSKD